ncbi:MAG: hypothetical protein RLO37_25900 [Coleofasciculus chthonoplastes F1-TOW-03]
MQLVRVCSKKVIINSDNLDSLVSLLRDDRVRAIIEPMLVGRELGDIPNDDVQFLIDLGLCRMSSQGGLAIANPIYQEVLPRVLSQTPPISDRTTTESANTPGNRAIVVIRG